MAKSKRSSKHSRCSCGRTLPVSSADELAQVRLDIEKAKLAKLRAELPDPNEPKYSKWEDLPPPSPEDEARYYEDFKRIFHVVAMDYVPSGSLEDET